MGRVPGGDRCAGDDEPRREGGYYEAGSPTSTGSGLEASFAGELGCLGEGYAKLMSCEYHETS